MPSLSVYLGRVLLIGMIWGLLWLVLVAILGALVLSLARAYNRRKANRLFPAGSVTTVELDQNSIVITRPGLTRSLPYREITLVRSFPSVLALRAKGRPRVELLPIDMLPATAIEFIRARAHGRWPVATLGERNPDRQMVVPVGWANHLTATFMRQAIRTPAFWKKPGLGLLVSVILAFVAGTWWLLVSPAWALLTVVVTHVRTRSAVAASLPPGSVASTEFLEDRIISRNACGLREIQFDDIRSVDLRGDVVLLGLASQSRTLMFARALFPDDRLQYLHNLAIQHQLTVPKPPR